MGLTNFSFMKKKKNTEAKWFSPPPPSSTTSPPPPSLWAHWPSSKNPKKVAFRAEKYDHDYNSDSWFTSSSEDEFDGASCMSTSSDDGVVDMKDVNFFESSTSRDDLPFEESSVVVVEPEDAYMDFKLSMEEMVAAKGLESMESLQELLEWYLRVNGEDRHDVIVEAFVDLVLEMFPSCS